MQLMTMMLRHNVTRLFQLLVVSTFVIILCYYSFTTEKHCSKTKSKMKDVEVTDFSTQIRALTAAKRQNVHSNYIIENENFCRRTVDGSDEKVFLLVVVRSRHVQQHERMTHRHINQLMNVNRAPSGGGSIKTIFIFGQDVAPMKNQDVAWESDFYLDIATANFVEHYQNLTLKLLFGVQWAASYCPHASFVMFVDIDMFINYARLVEDLQPYEDKPLYMGWVQNKSAVIRDKKNKWYLSPDMYPDDVFSPYCMGGGYVLSREAVRKAAETYQSIPLLPIEDVYMGLVMKQAGIVPTDNMRFLISWRPPVSPCVYREISAAHSFTATVLVRIWAEIAQLDEHSCRENPPEKVVADIRSKRNAFAKSRESSP